MLSQPVFLGGLKRRLPEGRVNGAERSNDGFPLHTDQMMILSSTAFVSTHGTINAAKKSIKTPWKILAKKKKGGYRFLGFLVTPASRAP